MAMKKTNVLHLKSSPIRGIYKHVLNKILLRLLWQVLEEIYKQTAKNWVENIFFILFKDAKEMKL